MAHWRVGTSGWTYRAWAGIFYPETLKSSDLLAYYSHRFNTVEVNTTFYRFPPAPLVKGWIRKSPDDFVFSVKSSRFFTHLKRLNVADPDFQKRFGDFLERLSVLEKKLGPILFQLPPHFTKNLSVLENFLAFLPSDHSFVVEFRHVGWFDDEVYALLKKYHVALAVVSAPGIPYVPMVTSSLAYFRLHGADSWYNYRYSYDELKDVAQKALQLGDLPGVKDVFLYFDNDVSGYAIENAKSLTEIFRALRPEAAKPPDKKE